MNQAAAKNPNGQESILELRVLLGGSQPETWRQMEIRGPTSLDQVHRVLQVTRRTALMLTVNHDLEVVESELLGGHLSCPRCAGRLDPWGWARFRIIGHGTGVGDDLVKHHPRRARCTRCAATHVLLAVSLAARRADSAEVIAAAIEAKTANGSGHRVITAELGRPPSTVRGWIRSFTVCASMITENFTALTVRDAPDAAGVWPLPVASAVGRALSVLAAYARVLGQRFGADGTVEQSDQCQPCQPVTDQPTQDSQACKLVDIRR